MSIGSESNREGPALEAARDVGGRCLCLHLQRAARATARRFDEVFRPLGLTKGQVSVMMTLVRGEGRSVGRISASLAMDRTTVTAVLKPLIRRHLVTIEVDAADRRSRLVFLTPAGRKLLAAALPLWTKTHAEIERLMPSADADRLRGDLRALS